jgi:hypothetical protein
MAELSRVIPMASGFPCDFGLKGECWAERFFETTPAAFQCNSTMNETSERELRRTIPHTILDRFALERGEGGWLQTFGHFPAVVVTFLRNLPVEFGDALRLPAEQSLVMLNHPNQSRMAYLWLVRW